MTYTLSFRTKALRSQFIEKNRGRILYTLTTNGIRYRKCRPF